ncbi:hypothetical protein [endosymbiont GvMRE of Glomus versiforme]|uniref:hypothetical protein n=1 Tax=endosymbiont GvMRE of Glomus versiforme TaxID=2039283 RepID=UPI000EBB0CD7|nr:hypothetical protein [endosymbiont GvMRE of Glomus versiforme]RHZ36738.1 hypothetical protein GvMRE_I2g561 [endosymbiont GvMRE of Glomus versiforme]RHZ37382.1 hypothetical protein GvMRE_I1g721 [endosymbiont GvMRE of Glomus versiforme]
MLNQQKKATSSQTSPYSAKWKWEKRHWLLVIALGCLALWWFSSQIKDATWLQNATNYLPFIGSLAFALETITKLAQ